MKMHKIFLLLLSRTEGKSHVYFCILFNNPCHIDYELSCHRFDGIPFGLHVGIARAVGSNLAGTKDI